MCVPESPCVNTEVESCFTKLHQHDLFDLQTTHTIILIHFCSPPYPVLSSCSHGNLPTDFLLPFSPLISFTVLSPLSLSTSFLSLCFPPPSSSLLPLHVISFISFVFLPPDLPLYILPLPSLSPLLWQAAHCSESVSWRQAAGLPQRWGARH